MSDESFLFRGWDLRNTAAPVFNLEGHQYAVRRVKVGHLNEYWLCPLAYFTIHCGEFNRF